MSPFIMSHIVNYDHTRRLTRFLRSEANLITSLSSLNAKDNGRRITCFLGNLIS